MLNKLKDRRVSGVLVLLALFFAQMVIHINVDNVILDDWVFWGVMESGSSVPAWLMERWET